jgi:hypothetical protein
VAISRPSRRTTCRWCGGDGALDLYHGNLRALDPGGVIFDQLPYAKYHVLIVEDVRPGPT